ncbi:tannase/feruloyl esterase family alpha/beta hydrolase [Emcibacter sp.]|uniref:tannase/feruloyl esterase family alpha/beta hydrolase n=1 Tax=Emcibacter sp. TaxID=1979954 RepID=UPI003A8DEFFE
MRKQVGFLIVVLAGLYVLLSYPVLASEQGCSSLSALSLKDVRITATEQVSGGGEWAYPPSVFNVMAGPNPGTEAAFCRVAGFIEKEIGFEVWLPANWNERFQAVGNGGLTGAINYPAMNGAVLGGFATASTDTGHVTPEDFFDASWIAGHPDRVENFGHRGHHLLAVTAKKIIAAYYGRGPKKSYFTGCSSGGWQGLTEAQKYPEDYDGIVAGAPANNFIRLQTRGFWVDALERENPDRLLDEAAVKLLVSGAYAKCDPLDGVRDGIISHPRSCSFDPMELVCKDGQKEGCLTRMQAVHAQVLYGPESTKKGMPLYPGNAYGASPFLVIPTAEAQLALTEIVTADERDWTPETFDPDRDIPELEKKLGSSLSAWETDLSAFRARGGKLIVYHGWTDPLLSPYNSIAYLQDVQKKMGDVGNFYRLFMVPGMDHCAGGPGPNRLDTVKAIVDWVEKGAAPETMIATGAGKDRAIRTRPLCVYPEVAHYNGGGDPDMAKNFECR